MKLVMVFTAMLTLIGMCGCGNGTPKGDDADVKALAIDIVKGELKKQTEVLLSLYVANWLHKHEDYQRKSFHLSELNEVKALNEEIESSKRTLKKDIEQIQFRYSKQGIEGYISEKYWGASPKERKAVREKEFKSMEANKAKAMRELESKKKSLDEKEAKLAGIVKDLKNVISRKARKGDVSNKTLEDISCSQTVQEAAQLYSNGMKAAYANKVKSELVTKLTEMFGSSMSEDNAKKLVDYFPDKYPAQTAQYLRANDKDALTALAGKVVDSIPMELKNIRLKGMDEKIKKSTNLATLQVGQFECDEMAYSAQSNSDGQIYVEVSGLPEDLTKVIVPYLPKVLTETEK